MITVFVARRIITLDDGCPEAECVAVRDGRILHVGSRAEVAEWLNDTPHTFDDRFAEDVVVPGFVEAHGHVVVDGAMSRATWLGFDDRRRADGSVAAKCRTRDEVVARLREALVTHQSGQLLGVGFDPVFHDRALTRHDLDEVSERVPVVVLNASLHLAYANTAALDAAGVDATTDVAGVLRDADGTPTGELHERAMYLVVDFAALLGDPEGDLRAGTELARRAGCTTVSDLANAAVGSTFDRLRVIGETTSVRLAYSPLLEPLASLLGDGLLDHLATERARDSERFFMGPLKLICDGSIQGFTAALGWPRYCGGHDEHAQLLLDADRIVQLAALAHAAGYQLALHTNGDEATQVALDAIERLLIAHPRPNHGHRLEHCQMATPAQFARMARLGVGVNLFANHVYYWGDVHRARTMGPDRARRMDALRSALDAGLVTGVHSDHPVTPLDPLFTMRVVRERLTRGGYLLGPHERVSAREALAAVTIGPARLMRRDHLIGTIEVGKFADFTVLDGDPLGASDALTDLRVRGTVVGGVPT